MKVIYNNLIPFPGFRAINLFGILFARKEFKELSKVTLNHEAIHTAQMKELRYVLFYILYLAEWIKNLFKYGFDNRRAYRNISFEKEAYDHQYDFNYLESRGLFAQWINKE